MSCRTPLFLICAVLALTPAVAHAAGIDVDGGHVRWDDGLESLGREAAAALPSVREEVTRRLGWPYAGPPVDVVVVTGHDRMQEEAHARVPEWAVGAAISSRALILIRSDLLSRGFGGGVVPVLRHEWVHLAWGDHAGDKCRRLPLWAEEGIAEDVGGAVSIDLGSSLDLAVVFDRLHDFQDLETSFPASPAQAALAYRQCRSWIEFVSARVGWPPLRDAVGAVATGLEPDGSIPGESPFAFAIRVHTGRSVGEWHAAWRVSLDEQAAPWFHLLLRDFQGAILTGLAAIAAVSFFFVLRRRRRLIARLPDDG